MLVRPKELANLCAIFQSTRSSSIPNKELVRMADRSMLIDSTARAEDVVSGAINAGLLMVAGLEYCPTEFGRELGKRQGSPACVLTEEARMHFIKNVLFNTRSVEWCCGEFLFKFHVDSVLGTFAYDRKHNESPKDTKWLMLLSEVKLIEVSKDQATVLPRYLGIINEFLADVRNADQDHVGVAENENNEVGALAENLAIEHEKNRLKASALPDLAELVQQISKVDLSAGYDIRSFIGTKEDPSSNLLIEVKGTKRNELRFVWSQNERRVAEKEKERYCIYIYTGVNLETGQAIGPTKVQNPASTLSSLGFKIVPLDVLVMKEI